MSMDGLLKIPSSPMVDQLFRLLSFGRRGLPKSIAVEENKKKKEVAMTLCGRSSEIDFVCSTGIRDKLLSDSSQTIRKTLLFVLSEVIEQQVLTMKGWGKEYVRFPLRKMIDAGWYEDNKSVKRAIDVFGEVMPGLEIGGCFASGKKKISQEEYEPLFKAVSRKDGMCSIKLNKNFDPNFIGRKTRIYLPERFPCVSGRRAGKEFDLLFYLCYLARVEKSETVKVRIESVQKRLGLPLPEECGGHPKQLIRDPIEKAVQAINDGEVGVRVKITASEKLSVFLSDGVLTASFASGISDNLDKAKARQDKKVIAMQKRKKPRVGVPHHA